MTPHINAQQEDIAKVVLMPGDPLRAKRMAEKFLTDVKLVNTVRNMLMYTGIYAGHRITIAASGMGCPSIGIYSYELFTAYDVDVIIRIGSAGAYDSQLKPYDIINVKDAYSESNFQKIVADIDDEIIDATNDIYELINKTARELEIEFFKGRVHSSDVFYRKNFDDYKKIFKEKQAIAVEMEAVALFSNAIACNKKAGCILTVSDSLVTKESIPANDRQNSFIKMMELALMTAVNYLKKT